MAPPLRQRSDDARAILAAALAAVDAGRAVEQSLAVASGTLRIGGRAPYVQGAPRRTDDPIALDLAAVERIYVVAAGKAARPMVEAAEAVLGDRLTAGVAAGGSGTSATTTFYAGGHPLPNPSSLMAARHVQRLLAAAGPRDLVLVLLSGGASAMLESPPPGVPLAEIAAATAALLGCGAPIDAVNAVRKHLSLVKGGGLLRWAAPAPVVTLALSDVVAHGGVDEAATIGSGPSWPDPTTFADAGTVLSHFDLWGRIPAVVADHLRAGMAGRTPDTVKPGETAAPVYRVVADGALAAAAAAAEARRRGYAPLILTTGLHGEAREAGRVLAAIAVEVAFARQPVAPPACLITRGETTVTLRRLGGTGGRSRELALAAALSLAGHDAVTLATLATDGVDGSPGGAGAVADGTTVARAAALGRDARATLDRHDSGPLFAALGDAIDPGPTGTNVGDLAIALVGAPPAALDAAP